MKARRVLIPVLASFALAASAAPAGAAAGDGVQSGAAPCLAVFVSHDPQANGEYISALAHEVQLGSVVPDSAHERPCS